MYATIIKNYIYLLWNGGKQKLALLCLVVVVGGKAGADLFFY